ncbi:MAG: hypothetical protein ABIR16_04910 [Dokdonella sp.]
MLTAHNVNGMPVSARSGSFQTGSATRTRPILIGLSLCCLGLSSTAHAAQIDWQGPEGSRAFGTTVKVLPNGNIVVTDPGHTVDGTYAYGAVYLYRPNGELISTLTGRAIDYVGSGGVYVVGDSNFVVCSPQWRVSTTSLGGGAATWVDGSVGLNGEVSAANSLTATLPQDHVCGYGVTTLANGHYVIRNPYWSDGAVQSVGAVSWCDGNKGCRGSLTTTQALMGSQEGDFVGESFGGVEHIFPLQNGDYVVASSFWSNGPVQRVGAVTLCGGQGQCNGLKVSALNSTVGARTDDFLGSPYGGVGISTPGVTALKNGDFVINSVLANSSSTVHVGAITRVAASSGMVGAISPSNSLYGTSENDFLDAGVTALESGKYVINVPKWDNGAIVDAGASVLCTAPTGCVGNLSAASGLTGSSANDRIGFRPAVALVNGDYVITSPFWRHSGDSPIGAVTLCSGLSGCPTEISIENSLVGSTPDDLIGNAGVIALSSGGYVVSSPWWTKGGVSQVGAVTHCKPSSACVGPVTPQNSLTGTSAGDLVGGGFPSAVALRNGNYVSQSTYWRSPAQPGEGAVTWGDGRNGTRGVVSIANSFTGTRSEETYPGPRLIPLSNSDYVVSRRSATAGPSLLNDSISLLRGYGPQTGSISPLNSVIAVVPAGTPELSFDHDANRDVLVVGNPSANKVTLLSVDQLFFNRFN